MTLNNKFAAFLKAGDVRQGQGKGFVQTVF
jgi:hypothetical protein